jgi:hypothetical protein
MNWVASLRLTAAEEILSLSGLALLLVAGLATRLRARSLGLVLRCWLWRR